jgi:hypothetical protein
MTQKTWVLWILIISKLSIHFIIWLKNLEFLLSNTLSFALSILYDPKKSQNSNLRPLFYHYFQQCIYYYGTCKELVWIISTNNNEILSLEMSKVLSYSWFIHCPNTSSSTFVLGSTTIGDSSSEEIVWTSFTKTMYWLTQYNWAARCVH